MERPGRGIYRENLTLDYNGTELVQVSQLDWCHLFRDVDKQIRKNKQGHGVISMKHCCIMLSLPFGEKNLSVNTKQVN